MLFEHLCDVWRNAAVGTNGRKAVSLHESDVSCLLLPMATRTAIEQGWNIGRAYDAFFPTGTDVKTGDQLKRDGETYTVSAVRKYETAYSAHIHALCQQEVA